MIVEDKTKGKTSYSLKILNVVFPYKCIVIDRGGAKWLSTCHITLVMIIDDPSDLRGKKLESKH